MSAEPTFPTMPQPVYYLAGGYCVACGAPCRGHSEPESAIAEAWAWRCADTIPDSAQGWRDSLADAETLLEVGADMFLSGNDLSIINAQQFGESALRALRGEIPDALCPCGCGKPARRWHFAERAAHAAFCALPSLR